MFKRERGKKEREREGERELRKKKTCKGALRGQ